MQQFFSNIVSVIGVTDAIDILIVAFVVYKVLGFIRESRAGQLVKGLLFLVAATFLSDVLHLYAINWILKSTISVGVIALVVVFQPELRRGLEQMGRSKIVKPKLGGLDQEEAGNIINEFVKAVGELSFSKTGALIVIEMETALLDVCETGTKIDGKISAELLGNIFYEGSPLHDGAVIVRGSKIYAAGCVLPLTENKELSSSLGTRHRAGIGISERSDAIVLIVSEETGIISLAQNGKLERYLDEKSVEKVFLNVYRERAGKTKVSRLLEKIKKNGRKKNVT